ISYSSHQGGDCVEGPDETIQSIFRGRPSWLASSGYSVGPGGQKGLQYLISILMDRFESDPL
ncbi:MAG TPA: hypothetical protein PLV56_04505, partial [Synergistales bacterium]|nr:hypothetical protein [Synergistales bacterium]